MAKTLEDIVASLDALGRGIHARLDGINARFDAIVARSETFRWASLEDACRYVSVWNEALPGAVMHVALKVGQRALASSCRRTCRGSIERPATTAASGSLVPMLVVAAGPASADAFACACGITALATATEASGASSRASLARS